MADRAVEEEEEMIWYEMILRPVSIGCQPNDFVDVDHSKGRHGIVAYERQLTDEELAEYEMRPWEG